jgi:RNA polymerase sigma-70 factor (ECF subfamily)
LLFYWARRAGLQDADAADVVQDVFTLLVQKLPQFAYDRDGSFRSWLRTILLNRCRNLARRPPAAPLADEQAVSPEIADVLAEADYRQHVVGRALQLMRTDFKPATWKAFWETTVAGRPAPEVAAELGMSVGALYVARSRVLGRLRQELAGLLD